MNFLKAYKERIEGSPNYEDDYVYYLVERFIKEYIPKVIEECIIAKNSKVDIAYHNIEEFFRKIMVNDIATAVRSGNIKGVIIPDTQVENTQEVQETSSISKTTAIPLDMYINKFSSYISRAVQFIYDLPFKSNSAHLEADLMDFINYYYTQLQCDDVIKTLTPEEEELKKYTRQVFKEQILLDFIPTLIETCKKKRKKNIEVIYSFDRGVAKFGNLEFPGLDLREFGKCINLLSAKDITDYASRSKDVRIENVYKFEFNLQDLESLYAKTQQVVSKETVTGETITR